jgi:glycosyltransferase involved in cell wall biosynthesis
LKILIDVVYTNRPRVCSTSYLAWEIIRELISWRDDLFFYVLYPPHNMSDDDWEFMRQYPDRVTLLPLAQSTSDRMSEEYMLRNALRFYLNPWCAHTWDADVVLSSRIPVLKHYRVHSARELGKSMRSHRLFLGLEEMPILPFRDTVAWSDFMYPDTLMSYGLLDGVLVNNQWTKKAMRPVLKEVLSVSWQKRVLDNLHEVIPVRLERLTLKKEMYQPGKDFEVAFVGRMTSTRNFRDVVDLFRKHFSYPIGPNRDKVKFRVSTNSMAMGGAEPDDMDFLEIQMNDRPKFHQFLAGAHVAVNLTSVEDFSLSTYETLRAGVPIIVYREPWNEFLGPDYPFRAANEKEAYALISAFTAKYDQMYDKFRRWEETTWASYVAGPLNVTTSEVLRDLIGNFESKRRQLIADTGVGGSYKERVSSIPAKEGKIDLTEYIRETGRMLDQVEDHFSLTIGRVPSTLMLKLMAETVGYRDTNQVGVMRKV